MTFFSSLKKELQSFSKKEKLFVLFAMLTGFCIAAEYGITRPASNGIFLTTFSSKSYPWVWLATVPLNLAIIVLYNRFLPKLGPKKVLLFFASLSIGINLIASQILKVFPEYIFFHYVWKDIYILLMFKQLWSMIHSTISSERAKYLYGLIFGMGTLGSITGSFIPGFFAEKLGSENLFLFTLPIYLSLMFFYSNAFKLSNIQPQQQEEKEPLNGFSLIRKNRFLVAVLLLVVLMQISVALMEYRFNAHLEMEILQKDLRTEYCGKLTGLMNLLSGAFQFIGGFLMVHTLGVRGSHLFVPLILLSNALFSFVMPSFAILSLSYVFLKSVDFSLFGVVREMLYIPLQVDEKYRAKAVIDVFAYRTSKAFVSLLILLLQFLVGSSLLPFLSYGSIVIFGVWIFVVLLVLWKSYPKPIKNI